jgi:hypothetical protein
MIITLIQFYNNVLYLFIYLFIYLQTLDDGLQTQTCSAIIITNRLLYYMYVFH